MIRSFFLTAADEVRTDLSREEISEALKSDGVLWVDFFRATREEQSLLADVFNFHPLAIEDCLHPVFRPRVDSFEDHLFLIVHGPDLATRKRELRTLELKAFLGSHYLVTFHRVPLRSVLSAQEQCEKASKKLLGRGADFLLYTLLDQMAENYTPILSWSEEQVQQIEEDVLQSKKQEEILPSLMRLRRDVLNLQRVIAAQRDAVNLLAGHGEPLIRKHAGVYFRDVINIFQRVLEQTETQRDALAGIRDTYLSMSANRTNNIMKTLTIMATLMLPTMFVSSYYGMNFKMPEFDWGVRGYVFAVSAMVAVTGGMLWYFRKKKWI